ncbi:MAG TPA: methionyl-tRNA formyltransferase, partial [Dehalococcoidia bacterium]|nr:methionyl-tRNA formyltransferase [Dehalococcoidia bacterium]
LCVMAFVTDIVPAQILESPKLGTIQYHPSLLPEHRGPSSMNWPIIQGKNKTGLTIFWPDEGLDTGPILLQKETEITPDETLGSLYFQKLYPMGIESIIESVHMVKKGTAPKIEQDHSKASYEGWCQSEDAIINWGENADQIYNLIRGCDPSPGANTKIQGCPISFFKASLSPTKYESTPGTVVEISENWFKISALQGSINVGRVQLKGTPKIMADEFIKTNNLVIGDTFG